METKDQNAGNWNQNIFTNPGADFYIYTSISLYTSAKSLNFSLLSTTVLVFG